MSSLAIDVVAQVASLESAIRAKKASLKAREAAAAWETKTKERNPQYVVGSIRKATDADMGAMKHCHGEVCEIVCEVCGATRIVNKQDAFQVRFCESCAAAAKRESRKEHAQVKRMEKKGATKESLEAELKALDAMLTA